MSAEQAASAPVESGAVGTPTAPAATAPLAPTETAPTGATHAEATLNANAAATNGTAETQETPAPEKTEQQGEALTTESGATNNTAAAATGDTAQAPAKKANGKRRSSAGAPDPKGKKAGGKKGKPAPILQLNVKPGEYYWARLKGHPPWPAVICDEEMLPEKIIETRPVTAQRPDGSYREDYLEGGKNVKDRTYAIMYLGTYEFSWMPNIDLSPIDMSEVHNATAAKKTKALWAAYEQLKEKHPLSYFKNVIHEHEQALNDLEAEAERVAKEKEEKKANKNKRKSKGAAGDGDAEMLDAPEDGAKPSKKRKKGAESDGDNDKAAKTPKTKLKVSLKTPNGASASKPKAKASSSKKSKKAVEEQAELTPEELFEFRKKQILYIRHKLQKGFLSRDTPPKEEEMDAMADHLSNLEKETELEASVIRATRNNKVLKGMLKLARIPRDAEFNFKERSTKLLEIWNKTLAEDKTGEEESEKKENGAVAEGDSEAKSTPAPKADTLNVKNETKRASETAPQPSAGVLAKDEDTTMTDAQPTKTEDVKVEEPKSEAPKEPNPPVQQNIAAPTVAPAAAPATATIETEKETGAPA